MIKLTRNQWCFALVAAGLTAAFHHHLFGFIEEEQWSSIGWYAGGYGVAMFLAGLAFGATDSVAKSRLDLGFGYHAITFVVVLVVGTLAALVYGQPVWPQLLGTAGWAVGLYVHYRMSRRTVKGLDAEEAFP